MASFNLPGMDTRTLAEEGVWMQVLAPNGKPLLISIPETGPKAKDEPEAEPKTQAVRIKLKGADSDTYRALRNAAVRKRLLRAAPNGGAGDPGALDPVASFAEEEEDTCAILAACTLDWEGMFDADGVKLAPTEENAKALYRNFLLIREQADRWIANRALFTKAS